MSRKSGSLLLVLALLFFMPTSQGRAQHFRFGLQLAVPAYPVAPAPAMPVAPVMPAQPVVPPGYYLGADGRLYPLPYAYGYYYYSPSLGIYYHPHHHHRR